MLVDDLDFVFKSRKVLFYLKNFLLEKAVLSEELFDVFFGHVAFEVKSRFVDRVMYLNKGKGKNCDLLDLKEVPSQYAWGCNKFFYGNKLVLNYFYNNRSISF